MAAVTFYQAMMRVEETVQLAEDQRLSLAGSGAACFLPQEAVILSDGIPFDTFDSQSYHAAEGNSRALASQFLNSFGGELGSCIVALAKVIAPSSAGVPQTQPTTILPLLYRFMALDQGGFASPPLINSRNITRGTPTYTGTGNGVLYRLNVDAYGYPLEGGFAQTLNATCTADAQSGTITGQEQFTVLGQPFRDALTWFGSGYGSGLIAAGSNGFVGVTADTTQALVQNSSFSQATGTGGTASFALQGWTQTAGIPASMQLDTVNYYRAAAIEGTTPASLQISGSVTITQQISSNAGALAITAYLNQLAWNGTIGTWVGTFTVQIGSKSWSVSNGATNWQTLRPAIDKNLWFQNFNQAALAVTITITITSGSLRIDDFCWSPMQDVGATLWWAVGGPTAWLVNDTIKAIDSEPNPPSKVQNWIRLMFPGYFLPSAILPAAPATAPTTALTGVINGPFTAGMHQFSVVYLVSGIYSPPGPLSVPLNFTTTNHVALSNIPLGPGGTTARQIFMTLSGQTAPGVPTLYLVTTIADNVTTTFDFAAINESILLSQNKQPGSYGDPVN